MTLGRGQRSNIIKFRLPCQFQRFLYQTLCVFSQMKDTKHIRREFYSVAWVMPQRWDFGALGVPRGSKKIKHGHVAYQIDGHDEQNRMQVTFSSYGQTGDLEARSKGQISLTCQFQRFLYQTLFVFSQIKDRKHIEQNFHFVARVMPQGGTCGYWEESKTLAWGFAMEPYRLRALVYL